MAFKGWNTTEIVTDDGRTVPAVAPLIVSASRATDIPAFYTDWFFSRLQRGYARRVNPFNGQSQYISFGQSRVFVFWSKNPAPLALRLDEFERYGYGYYFLFTLNDYGRLEPGVPPLAERIETFKALADRLGPERVIWRYDPLLLEDGLTVKELLGRITSIGDQLAGSTRKLVFSFAGIDCYRKVAANMRRKNVVWHNFSEQEKQDLIGGLARHNASWGLELASCADADDYSAYGVIHNRCLDDRLMRRLYADDQTLMRFLGEEPARGLFGEGESRNTLKDPGQRESCGCVVSRDIGHYNTCGHFCAYCYANASDTSVKNCMARAGRDSDALLNTGSGSR